MVILCYNQAQFLHEPIESVLAQSYPKSEIVVLDDGSTDSIAEIARRYSSVRYVYQENAGLSGAGNTGLRQSRGEFLVFLDADDRLLPHALEIGVGCMHDHPECAFVSGRCRVISSNGLPVPSRDFVKANSRYREAYQAGSRFWKDVSFSICGIHQPHLPHLQKQASVVLLLIWGGRGWGARRSLSLPFDTQASFF